jgi:hypothetical protein
VYFKGVNNKLEFLDGMPAGFNIITNKEAANMKSTMPEVPKLLHLAPPSRFCFYLPPPEKKQILYIWNINNKILLERPSSNTWIFLIMLVFYLF